MLDQQHLQLIFNVVAITAVTSLASICYLLKRDKQELLAGKSSLPRHREPQSPKNSAAPPALQRVSAAPLAAIIAPQAVVQPPQQSAPEPPAQPELAPASDISRFVTQRSQTWVAPSETQWKSF